jgi:hypothetical protein
MKRSKRPSPSRDYEIGYRRPPRTTQFKPGQSGNPRGRPKGARSVGTILLDVSGRRIAVTENGETRRIPTIEVVLRRLANDAIRGDRLAAKLFISLVERNAHSPATLLETGDLLAEDRDILKQYMPNKNVSKKRRRTRVHQKEHQNGQ